MTKVNLAKNQMTFSEYMKALKENNILEPRPLLKQGWFFFEHVTLPRFVFDRSSTEESSYVFNLKRLLCCGDDKMERAEPGEELCETRLYSPIYTPLDQMGDFGIGIGLYFSTLLFIALMTFIAGLINLPNIAFFRSDEYSSGQSDVLFVLQGSAVCTDQTWVPCPTCNMNYVGQERSYKYIKNGNSINSCFVMNVYQFFFSKV